MGNCLNTSQESVNHNINVHAKNYEEKRKATHKLLLLGTGASGKSTLFRQLKSLHGNNIDDTDRIETLSAIRQNLVAGIVQILRKGNELYEQNNEKYIECKLDKDDEKINNAISKIIPFFGYEFSNITENNFKEMKMLGQAINFLWLLPNIQATYKMRGGKFAFPENMVDFFNRVNDIMSPNYIPSEDDVLKTRIRTTGIIEHYFNINNQGFYVCDVGGQRNERRKWINSFSDVTAVLFVAALNHYNALLFEDETKNAMHESIDLFHEICLNKWFRKSEIILFLNKDDLFQECLKEGYSLSICFGKQTKWRNEGPFWEGMDYYKKDDEKEDKSFFKTCYTEALQFIQNIYINSWNKNIFIHVTCATDRNNVDKVFWDVQNMIIRINLNNGGLLSSNNNSNDEDVI